VRKTFFLGKKKMILKQNEQVQWLEFELLQEFPRLSHAVFLRQGGVSLGPFSSLNVSVDVGDDPAFVQENYRRIMQKFCGKQKVLGRQVHGAHIARIGPHLPEVACDGLITDVTEYALSISHADCQAAIFYDPVQHIVANVHCGWRGSVQNIYQNTVDCFVKQGSHPSDLHVCISPSLGPNRAEFIHFQKELPKQFLEFCWKDFLFDFWEISASQLKKAGVLPSHIQIAKICTYENKEDYFSYRRDKVTGRHATIVSLS
jgi:polyphenol oxidase